MPLYLPFIPLFIWFGAIAVLITVVHKLWPNLSDEQSALVNNCIFGTAAAATTIIIIFLAKAAFPQGLKGFGLNVRTIPKDLFAGMVNLFSIWPILTAVFVLTVYFGKLIQGPEFEIQQHQGLELITTYSQVSLRILIIITAVVLAPLFEEMLFRGLLQTMFRSSLSRLPFWHRFQNRTLTAWLSIAISSGLFAVVHYEPSHWPILFVLSMAIGYSYEKSGSLFRPILIHSLFNAASITAALYSAYLP
jgi:membrane protease YdiL (CAAX protease family)